jgi:hypothetical protein
LLHNFYSETFQRGYASGVIGQQPDASQVQVREDLRTDADLTLRLAFAFRKRGQPFVAMEGKQRLFPDALDGESL